MPEFYIIIASKIFFSGIFVWRGVAHDPLPPSPISYAYGKDG